MRNEGHVRNIRRLLETVFMPLIQGEKRTLKESLKRVAYVPEITNVDVSDLEPDSRGVAREQLAVQGMKALLSLSRYQKKDGRHKYRNRRLK
ncbi:hypothetical protein SISSUDRAFT_1048773 [Sistotremastrum suecicum HHB10207 ss-3]|uniref:Uncharacterized protein n=1 Tax=Sistotremastrum suecicum HHB10207 ss-3 TaxID=1314776 RepID=A0A166C9N9_9AGAM|nr:hypothetical protein SISSUDRAFT_1048773 [Sistotremastrum suecicum HHB10207 ss-3]